MAIFIATLLLLLTSPPSSALEAKERQIRPQAKSSQEILNGKQTLFFNQISLRAGNFYREVKNEF